MCGIECVRTELGEPDASGRRRPVEVPGSEFTMDADLVVIALGTNPNPLIPRTTGHLETNAHGCIVADPDTGATSREGVFAGGDIVTGAATVILAMGAGRKAATAIHEYLRRRAVEKERREAEESRRGHRDGIAWASEYATADELRDVVARVHPGSSGSLDTGHSLHDFINDKHQGDAALVPSLDSPYWRGFVAAAEGVLDSSHA